MFATGAPKHKPEAVTVQESVSILLAMEFLVSQSIAKRQHDPGLCYCFMCDLEDCFLQTVGPEPD